MVTSSVLPPKETPPQTLTDDLTNLPDPPPPAQEGPAASICSGLQACQFVWYGRRKPHSWSLVLKPTSWSCVLTVWMNAHTPAACWRSFHRLTVLWTIVCIYQNLQPHAARPCEPVPDPRNDTFWYLHCVCNFTLSPASLSRSESCSRTRVKLSEQ